MESLPNGSERLKSPEEIKIPIEVQYSVDNEVSRIRRTIDKYSWFIENGYKPRLPQAIKDRLENGDDISDDEIKSATEGEYQNEMYQAKANEIRGAWEIESGYFLEKLKTLGRPMVEQYTVFLTKYGTGGSYGYPNLVQLNLNNTSNRGVLYVTFHEMVHLTIQDLIEKYKIPHWTKERLVDLTMNNFFPDKKRSQRDPENAEEISEIFKKEFPDIEKIIAEISKPNAGMQVSSSTPR